MLNNSELNPISKQQEESKDDIFRNEIKDYDSDFLVGKYLQNEFSEEQKVFVFEIIKEKGSWYSASTLTEAYVGLKGRGTIPESDKEIVLETLKEIGGLSIIKILARAYVGLKGKGIIPEGDKEIVLELIKENGSWYSASTLTEAYVGLKGRGTIPESDKEIVLELIKENGSWYSASTLTEAYVGLKGRGTIPEGDKEIVFEIIKEKGNSNTTKILARAYVGLKGRGTIPKADRGIILEITKEKGYWCSAEVLAKAHLSLTSNKNDFFKILEKDSDEEMISAQLKVNEESINIGIDLIIEKIFSIDLVSDTISKMKDNFLTSRLGLIDNIMIYGLINNYLRKDSFIKIYGKIDLLSEEFEKLKKIGLANKDIFIDFFKEIESIVDDYNNFLDSLNSLESVIKDDEYYRYLAFYLKSLHGNNDFSRSYISLADKFNFEVDRFKTDWELLKKIDSLIKTVPLKQVKIEKHLKLEEISHIPPEGIIKYFKANLEKINKSFLENESLVELLSSNELQYLDLTNDIIEAGLSDLIISEIDQRMGDGFFSRHKAIINGILNSNLEDSKKAENLSKKFFKEKKVSNEEENAIYYLWREILNKADLLPLIDKHLNETVLNKDTNLFIAKLSEIQSIYIPDLERDLKNKEIELNLKEILKDDRLTKELNMLENYISRVQRKVEKRSNPKMKWILKNRSLVSLWQGKEAGTCFGDRPEHYSNRKDIIPIRLIKNDEVIGNALFFLYKKRFILIGFDPSEKFTGGVSSEALNNYAKESLHVFQEMAKINNAKLALANKDEVGSLTNRRNSLEEFILLYLDASSAKAIPIEPQEKLHPGYSYIMTNFYELSDSVIKKLDKPLS